jgi:N4-gp56 family major capsid protein
MANVNVSPTFSADISNYIAKKTLPLVQRQLVAYQFGDMLRLPKQRGTIYTASRYDRISLPFSPLSEGIPPVGESLVLVQVNAVAQQWGDTVTVTDVADFTIEHPLFKKAIELVALQMSETLERNTFNNLLAGTQINYVNTRGARASLVPTDVLNPHEVNRAFGALVTIGAPMFNGQMEEDAKISAGKPSMASKDPKGFEHYVALVHSLVEQDMRENPTVVTAWQYSDVNKLYNNELGYWGGMRWCRSNMIPFFVGVTAPTTSTSAANGSYAASTTGGLLATGSYYVAITGSVTQNGYEQRVGITSGAISVTGPNGSIAVTTPNVAGYTWNVYIGTTSTVANLGTTSGGPNSGPLAGQAVQLNGNTTYVITSVGSARVPPAAPAAGVTVFPTFIFGKGAYGQVMLDDPKFSYLSGGDKSDPLNQLRVVGWKVMYGTLLINQNFFMRIESSSAFTATFG